jgi:acetylornithine deacetylase/succinyl-diaminopimelate desuccinylase-like protein
MGFGISSILDYEDKKKGGELLAPIPSKTTQSIISSVEHYAKDIVETCSELIQIDSSNPPGDCSQIVSYLKSEYRKIGADFRIVSADKHYLKKLGHRYPRNNFVSRIGPRYSSGGLAIGTHMDVVPPGDKEKWRYPPFSGTIAQSKIWGRGAVDAKCSLTSQLWATKVLIERGVTLNVPLFCIGTVDDEAPKDATGAGMEYVVREGLGSLGYNLPEFAINAEASGLGNIWGTFSGGLTVRIRMKGKTGHPPAGVNALDYSILIWNAIIKKRNRVLFPEPPRLIWSNGGSELDFGLTPERAHLIFRIPILAPEVTPSIALGEIKRIIREEHQKDHKLVVDEVSLLARGRAFNIGRSNQLVRTLKSCAGEAGVNSQYGGGVVGPGDLQFFLRRGIQGVTYGAGSLDRCHVPNEFVATRELIAQAKIYALAASRLCTT